VEAGSTMYSTIAFATAVAPAEAAYATSCRSDSFIVEVVTLSMRSTLAEECALAALSPEVGTPQIADHDCAPQFFGRTHCLKLAAKRTDRRSALERKKQATIRLSDYFEQADEHAPRVDLIGRVYRKVVFGRSRNWRLIAAPRVEHYFRLSALRCWHTRNLFKMQWCGDGLSSRRFPRTLGHRYPVEIALRTRNWRASDYARLVQPPHRRHLVKLESARFLPKCGEGGGAG
jgi:hypothetical protein